VQNFIIDSWKNLHYYRGAILGVRGDTHDIGERAA
jgi:hypothetical protein